MASETPLPRTLLEAVKYFAKPENCLSYLVASRWPKGVTCPVCGSQRVHFDKTRMGWRCATKHPGRKFTLKTGTIFEDSPIGLDKWLLAVWMISGAKNGISSHELARALGVTQKTAWFMLHRIRLAQQSRDDGGKLGGDVEIDETFIGGRARNMHKDKRARVIPSSKMAGKVAVMGLLERNTTGKRSRVRMAVVPTTRRHHLRPIIDEHIERGANVYTDALRSYRGLDADYIHNVIDHAEMYADGQVHTNGLENVWSLLQRTIKGTYVGIEPFHLFRYLDEQAFRFNEREGTDADRFRAAIDGILNRRLTYDALTGKEGLESSPV